MHYCTVSSSVLFHLRKLQALLVESRSCSLKERLSFRLRDFLLAVMVCWACQSSGLSVSEGEYATFNTESSTGSVLYSVIESSDGKTSWENMDGICRASAYVSKVKG
ncbi:hypothetical protein MHYP_G00200960 [Metynnis hypsauchen]